MRFLTPGGCLLVAFALGLAGCQTDTSGQTRHPSGHSQAKKGHAADHASLWAAVTEAVAVIHPTAGHQARGVVRFTQQGQAVRVVADLEGLPPGAPLGFHIHEYGDCSAADAMSAGGHYNPQGHPHAGPEADKRHAGDMGNVQPDASGKAHYELSLRDVSLAGMKNPIIGRAVVIHAKADDLKSQPTGDAGARIGCGVIGLAKPASP